MYYSVWGLLCLRWGTINKVFVCVFIFYWQVWKLKITVFWHYWTDHSGIGFPFFFTFLLVVLEEVVIRFECWKFCVCAFGSLSLSRKCDITINWNIWSLNMHIWTIVVYNDWHNRAQARKSSLFKLDQVLSVWSSSLWINDKWWIFTSFNCVLSFLNLIKNWWFLILGFVITFNIETTATGANNTYEWQLFSALFGNVWWNSDMLMSYDIHPALVIWNYSAISIKWTFPVWT